MVNKRVLLYFVFVLFAFFFNFYFRPIKGNSLVDEQYRKSEAYINDLYKSDEYFKEHLLSENDYELYYATIDASLKNDSSFSVPCYDECPSLGAVADALILDHPELISYQLGSICWDEQDYYYCTNNQNLNVISTYLGTRRIAREMENIRRDTKNMSDKDKIIYVYDYVASHDYDRGFTWSKSNQSAYSFFTKGTTVCAGFAKASQIIFQNIGIKSYLVLGYDHLWNYVEYEGKYYVFDATVGASFHNKKRAGYYDGLGETTVDHIIGSHEELYPKIEEERLRDIFNL